MDHLLCARPLLSVFSGSNSCNPLTSLRDRCAGYTTLLRLTDEQREAHGRNIACQARVAKKQPSPALKQAAVSIAHAFRDHATGSQPGERGPAQREDRARM